MKLGVICLCIPTVLSACSAASGPSITLLVQKPSGADDSCLGVVGFDVSSVGAGKTAQSGPILNTAAVQTPDGCRLDHPFTVEGLTTNGPVTVTVHGYDGAGQARVSGMETIDDLGSAVSPIVLKVDGTPPPPLILNRQTLLGGVALSEVQSMTITTAKGQPMTLLAVTPNPGTRGYFDVDPGGFGVEGVMNGQDLTVEFTFAAGMNLPKQRVVTTLDSAGPVFRVQ